MREYKKKNKAQNSRMKTKEDLVIENKTRKLRKRIKYERQRDRDRQR